MMDKDESEDAYVAPVEKKEKIPSIEDMDSDEPTEPTDEYDAESMIEKCSTPEQLNEIIKLAQDKLKTLTSTEEKE